MTGSAKQSGSSDLILKHRITKPCIVTSITYQKCRSPLICTWMKTGDYGNEPLFARGCIFGARVRRLLVSDQDDATDSAFKRGRDSMEMQQVGFDHDDLRARPRRSSCVVQLRSSYRAAYGLSSLRKQGPIRRGGCG